MKILVLVVALGSLTGCSFLFTRRVPERPATDAPCTDSRALAIADLVVGVSGAIVLGGGTYGGFASTDGSDRRAMLLVGIGVGTLWALPWAVSAGFGLHWVGQCRALKRAASGSGT